MKTAAPSKPEHPQSYKRLLGYAALHDESDRSINSVGAVLPPLRDDAHTVVELNRVIRIAITVAPKSRGSLAEQTCEVLEMIERVLQQEAVSMAITIQTVFVRSPEDVDPCRLLFQAYFGSRMPVTNFVPQPPCCGAALSVEAWAVGGSAVDVEFPAPNLVTVAYDGIKWFHCAGITSKAPTAYEQTTQAFTRMRNVLAGAGVGFHEVVRTWLYQGGITADENGTERYRELNRARTDFFDSIRFENNRLAHHGGKGFYPASTGIGTLGRGLVTSCLALQTTRKDVRLLPLENPLQTPSYCYEKKFSIKSPKFSRAMVVLLGNYMTTWVSGTASIVNSETRYAGDIERQTEQTIDNIECLISANNLAYHGVSGGGATLRDLAKVRVYIKRPEDYLKCRAVVERRLGHLPTIYAQADVCRPDLLVEIEGVAFAKLSHNGNGHISGEEMAAFANGISPA